MVKKVIFFVFSFFSTLCVIICIAIINSYIFLDPIIDEQAKERINAARIVNGEIVMDHSVMNVPWPLPSIIFFVVVMSLYWFFYGRMSKIYFPSYPRAMILLLPVLCSVVVQDFYFLPVYFVVCFLGVKSVAFKKA